MADIIQHPATYPPAPAVLSILARYNRQALQAFIEIAIDLADVLDGDPDMEDIDEREPDGDDRGDIAWPEWHMRPPHARQADRELVHTGGGINGTTEDDETDDHPEDDDPGGCEHDGRESEDWEAPVYGIDQTEMLSVSSLPHYSPVPDFMPSGEVPR